MPFSFKDRRSHDRARHICCHNSPAARARDLFKPSKDPESLLVSIEKKIGKLWIFFCGLLHMAVGLRIFGRDDRVLGANPTSQFLDSIFYWKLGYNPSFLSP